MKTLRFAMYLFYRYYSKGNKYDNGYFHALCAMSFIVAIHLFQLLVIFDKVSWIPISKGDTVWMKKAWMALCLLPVFLLVYMLAKPSQVKALSYPENKIRRGNRNLIVYLVATIVMLFVLIFIFATSS